MKNTIGHSVCVTLFGESHGPAVGAVIDGLAPGIKVDTDYIDAKLEKRRPYGRISTARREADNYSIISGVYNGMTTGTPICIIIPNNAQISDDYTNARGPARPGHADHTAHVKYHGYEDYRGGGHFSGRITAALVAAGALIGAALEQKGILTGTHIARLGGACDRSIGDSEDEIRKSVEELRDKRFSVLDDGAADLMKSIIEEAAADGDSVGGVLETAITGVDAGIGEPWFDTLEGAISHIIFSIPGIKGIEFGAGFDMAVARGSEFNDALLAESGRIITETNNNGGINGGISNGMPIVFRMAVKPTPSIRKEQRTVDLITGENTKLEIKGRHDPAIIHRACAVADAATAIVLADMLALRYGTDWLADN